MKRNTMQVSLLGDSRVHTVSNGFENSPSIFFVLYFSAIGNVSAHWKHAEGESTEKVEKRDFRAVGNGILWLTPCKLACERSLETGPNIVASVGDGRSW